MSALDDTLTLTPAGPGRYTAVIDAGWNGGVSPNGGVLAALAVRAVQTFAGEGAPPPRTVSAFYLEAPAAGSLEVAVTLLRGGRRVTVHAVEIGQAGRRMITVTVLSSVARPHHVPLRRAAPTAPPAPEVEALEIGQQGFSPPVVFGRLVVRPVFGALPFSGASEGEAGGWLSLRDDDRPLDAARLVAMCDLWWPAIFPVLPKLDGAPTLQLTVHLRDTGWDVRPPALGRYTTETVAEGHLEERAEIWSSDGRLLAESVQLALLVPLG
jgi:Thioesterase-like superfamily